MKFRKNINPVCIREGGDGNMGYKETAEAKRAKGSKDLKLEDVDSFISTMENLLGKLSEKTEQLPKVDKTGYSECPFAEDLYAYKEESYEKVVEESKKSQPYLSLVEEEIGRCRKNIEHLRLDASSLNLEEAKSRYAGAEQSQKSQYNKAVNQKKRLIDVIKKTSELISTAKKKKWPLERPKQQRYLDPAAAHGDAINRGNAGAPRSQATTPSQATRPNFIGEIDDLISMGPLGRGKS